MVTKKPKQINKKLHQKATKKTETKKNHQQKNPACTQGKNPNKIKAKKLKKNPQPPHKKTKKDPLTLHLGGVHQILYTVDQYWLSKNYTGFVIF